jgi:hypothetical protein
VIHVNVVSDIEAEISSQTYQLIESQLFSHSITVTFTSADVLALTVCVQIVVAIATKDKATIHNFNHVFIFV